MPQHARQISDETESWLDEVVWNELSDLMGDGLQPLVEKFIHVSEGYVENILSAIMQNNPAVVQENAHPLKSSSQQLSAYKLSALARVIEAEAVQYQAMTPVMRDSAGQLREVFDRSVAALRARVA